VTYFVKEATEEVQSDRTRGSKRPLPSLLGGLFLIQPAANHQVRADPLFRAARIVRRHGNGLAA
jgi:hypothetical protein